jgi:hypothetical protein
MPSLTDSGEFDSVGSQYASELAQLAQTYRTSLAAPVGELADAIGSVSSVPTAFVGAGGTFALASFAADEHIRRTGYLATAVTPLQFVANAPAIIHCAVVIFSARVQHHDIVAVAKAARMCATGPIILVTQRLADKLDSELRGSLSMVVTVPARSEDGFLATNSLLGMATAWAVAAGHEFPSELPSLGAQRFVHDVDCNVRRIVVLHAAEQRFPALDLEARLSESGLTDVQVTDLRNMAHGRHYGLSRHSEATALVTLTGPEAAGLTEHTLSLLPSTAYSVSLATRLRFPVGAIDVLAGGMRLFGQLAEVRGIDPGQPPMSEKGMQLHRLRW